MNTSTTKKARVRPYWRAILTTGALLLIASAWLGHSVSCVVEKVGGNPSNGGYGAWPTCVNLIRHRPRIWSFGVGCDTTFELDLKQRFHHADIHSFDPTINQARFEHCMDLSYQALYGVPMEKSSVFFEQKGLANQSGFVKFKKSNDPRIGSKSIAYGIRDMSGEEYKIDDGATSPASVETLRNLYKSHGILPTSNMGYVLDVLKLDVEGAEFDIVPSWCRTKFHPLAKQILVEFHERLFLDAANKRNKVYACLQDLGYLVVHEHEPSKEEVVFVHFKRLK